MAEEAMVNYKTPEQLAAFGDETTKASLTQDMIRAGEDLLRRLDKADVGVSDALWLYVPEVSAWQLLIASRRVRTEGPKKLYKKIQTILGNMPKDAPRISLRDVSVAHEKIPLLSLLRIVIRTGPGINGVRFTGNTINGVFIEDAYIYRVS